MRQNNRMAGANSSCLFAVVHGIISSTNSNLSNSMVMHLIAFFTSIYAPLYCSFARKSLYCLPDNRDFFQCIPMATNGICFACDILLRTSNAVGCVRWISAGAASIALKLRNDIHSAYPIIQQLFTIGIKAAYNQSDVHTACSRREFIRYRL